VASGGFMERIFPRANRRELESTRWISALAGGAMIAYGMKRGSLFGGLLALAGADLATKALIGHHLYETVGITSLTRKGVGASIPHQLGIKVHKSVTIQQSPSTIYDFLKRLENWPRFMTNLRWATQKDENHSRWIMRGAENAELEWDAEIINDIPNEILAWRSVNCPHIDTAGSIRLEPAREGRGTVVRLSLQYLPPGGSWGALAAKLFGKDPAGEIAGHLHKLKQILETGESATTEGQSVGGSLLHR